MAQIRNPRDAGSRLRVTIDAVDGQQYLNGLDLSLQLSDPSRSGAGPESMRIPPSRSASVDHPARLLSPR